MLYYESVWQMDLLNYQPLILIASQMSYSGIYMQTT